MNPIEIITLQPHDWQRYREIRLEALLDAPQAFGTTYADMVQRPESFWKERLEGTASGTDSWLLFAQNGARIVGIIGAFLLEESSAALIVSVYVTPEYRGTGVSRTLMQAILDTLKQKDGIQTVKLDVTAGQEAAIGLYRRFGFEIVEEKEDLLGDGQAHIKYTMEKSLWTPTTTSGAISSSF